MQEPLAEWPLLLMLSAIDADVRRLRVQVADLAPFDGAHFYDALDMIERRTHKLFAELQHARLSQ